ncbi:MAG: hypothetical protein ACFFFH_20440 [Candidatus Thorarchaeota archaeon]
MSKYIIYNNYFFGYMVKKEDTNCFGLVIASKHRYAVDWQIESGQARAEDSPFEKQD